MDFGLAVAIFFILAIYSFLYKDNPLFKIAEHVFVGVAAGYYLAIQYHSNFLDNLWHPLTGRGVVPLFTGGEVDGWALALSVPLGVGLLMLLKFFPRHSYLARWPMAVVVGSYAGLAVIGFGSGDLIIQIRANVLPFIMPGSVDAFLETPGLFTFLDILTNPLLILGLPCCLLYFFFSREHRGAVGKAARVGIWLLMISFGASYGNTVMTRISLLIERVDYLMNGSTTTIVIGSAVILILVFLHFSERRREPL